MKKILFILSFVLFFIITSLQVSSLTVYVNQSHSNCSDSNSRITASDLASPWCTPTSTSMDKVLSGDIVQIIAGTKPVYHQKLYLRNKALTDKIQVMPYPGESQTPILTKALQAVLNKTAGWTQISTTPNVWNITSSTTQDCFYGFYNGTNRSLMTYCVGFSLYGNWSDFNKTSTPEGIWFNGSIDMLYIKLDNASANPNNISFWIGTIYPIQIENVTGAGLELINLTSIGNGIGAFIQSGSKNITFVGLEIEAGYRGIDINNGSNITIKNTHIFSNRWNWTWDEQKNTPKENFGVWMQRGYDGINITGNKIDGWFNGISPFQSVWRNEFYGLEISYNNLSNIYDDAIEPELYANCYHFHHNFIHDVHVALTLSYMNSSACRSKVEYEIYVPNITAAPGESNFNRRAFKFADIEPNKTNNIDFNHNTIVGYGIMGSSVNYDIMANINWTNNIFVVNSSEYVAFRTGLSTSNVFYDYNLYYNTGNGNLFTYWNNDSDTRNFTSLASVKANGTRPTAWDNHSLNKNPLLDNNFRAYTGISSICGAASDGGDIGALSCIAGIQINDTEHHVLGSNQSIVTETSTLCGASLYKVRDGDWSTYFFINGGCSGAVPNIVYNYYKPNVTQNQRLLAGNLTYKDNFGTQRFSILNTDTCFNYNSEYIQAGYTLAPYCNNGTTNVSLYFVPGIVEMYEQKMNWTIAQSNINLTEQTTPIYENSTLVLNAIQTNYPTFTTEVYIYNSSGNLLYTYSGSPNVTVILNFTSGLYYVNATSYNSTHYTNSNNINYTWYSANTTIIKPITNENVTRFLNVSYLSSFTTNLVNVSYYNVSIANITGHPIVYLMENGGVNTTITDYFTYPQNLSTGIYYIKVSMLDTAGYWTHQQTPINITRNLLINISARTALNNNTIANFSFNDYISNILFNLTQNTTTGNLLLDSIRGNHTFIIDANQYFANTNITTINITNITTPTYTYFFYLYESNTLNISFYNEANPFTLLTGINISMDMFSDIYSNNFTTSTGNLYLTLLIPTTYTLRYSAPGYSQRFYEVTVDNRSYQNVNLYLINTTISQNITITVIDEIGNPVEGAVVKALKYNLVTNTYIQQEIGVTNAEGKVVMHLTMNDEYYKFIVEIDGVVAKITDPAYITSTTYTIQIATGSEIGTEFSEFYSISHDLSFNTATNNFRFDFSDSNNIASQFCLYVYQYNNFSTTTYNSSCTTDASGTILLGVSPINGTTYLARSYYVQSGYNKQLDQLYHTFSGSGVLTTTYGLFLQFLITGFFALSGVFSMGLAAIITPFSLIIGKFLYLNNFDLNALGGLQIVGIIIAIILSKQR